MLSNYTITILLSYLHDNQFGTYLIEIVLSRDNTTGCEDSCIFDTKFQADHLRIVI